MGPIVPKQNWLRSTEAQEEDVVQELLVGALPMEATNKLQCMEALLVGEVLEVLYLLRACHTYFHFLFIMQVIHLFVLTPECLN